MQHESTVLRPAYGLVDADKPCSGVDSDVIFVGSFLHTPNIEGMNWFVRNIMPKLVKKKPNIIVTVVGQGPPGFLFNAFEENIRVLGYVEDLNSLILSSRCAIAPLLSGAGVKGKILSSLSAGLPVVTTTVEPKDCRVFARM